MIKATIYKNSKQECVGFRTTNHAGSGEAGRDLVCAAVSMLVINTINAIERFTDAQTTQLSDDREGLIDYRLKSRPTPETELLLNTMILGLLSLEDDRDYTAYIDVIFEEV